MDDDFWKGIFDDDEIEYMQQQKSSHNYKRKDKKKLQSVIEPLKIDKTPQGSFLLVLMIISLAAGIVLFVAGMMLAFNDVVVAGVTCIIIAIALLLLVFPILDAIRKHFNNKNKK